MTQATTSPQPVLPADVTAFAAEHGVADYVAPVQEMTRRVFPGAPVTLLVEEDAEIADRRYIAVEVDVTGMDERQLFAAQRQWTASIFQHCPATHVHCFCLGVVTSA
jgi:hypothetical protein